MRALMCQALMPAENEQAQGRGTDIRAAQRPAPPPAPRAEPPSSAHHDSASLRSWCSWRPVTCKWFRVLEQLDPPARVSRCPPRRSKIRVGGWDDCAEAPDFSVPKRRLSVNFDQNGPRANPAPDPCRWNAACLILSRQFGERLHQGRRIGSLGWAASERTEAGECGRGTARESSGMRRC